MNKHKSLNDWAKVPKCRNCFKYGHYTNQCRGRPFCYYCQKNNRIGLGHRFLECEYSKKYLQDRLTNSMRGYNSCAQGMADEEGVQYEEIIHRIIKKSIIKSKYSFASFSKLL